jgi:hypothetical protein
MVLNIFLWERHLAATVSWLEATPTRAFITDGAAQRAANRFFYEPIHHADGEANIA